MKNIELINSTSQTVASGGTLNLGNVNIKTCFGAFSYNGTNTITLVQNGTYQIIVKTNAISTVANQTVGFALAYNGTISTIANAGSVVATIGDVSTLTIPKMVKICDGNTISITIVNSGSASTTYQNLIVDIIKVA